MKQEDYDFFKHNGYLSLGKILNDDEVAALYRCFRTRARGLQPFLERQRYLANPVLPVAPDGARV